MVHGAFVLTIAFVVVAFAAPAVASVGLNVRNGRIQIVHKIQLNPGIGITDQDLRSLSKRVALEIKDRIAASNLTIGSCTVTAAPQVLLPPHNRAARSGFNQITVVNGPVTDPNCPVPPGATLFGCTERGTRIVGGWSDTIGTWSMNAPQFIYAHEAGHMMGLHGSTADANADPIMAEGRALTAADLFDGALRAEILSKAADVAACGVITREAIADAWFMSDSPDQNVGSLETLSVGYSDQRSIFGPVASNRRAVIQFSLNGINVNSIGSATVHLTYAYIGTAVFAVTSGTFPVKVHEISSNWTETTITWNNAPQMGALIDTFDVIAGSDFQIYTVDVDVTAYVKASNSPTISILLVGPENLGADLFEDIVVYPREDIDIVSGDDPAQRRPILILSP
jgi:hypothetical protein